MEQWGIDIRLKEPPKDAWVRLHRRHAVWHMQRHQGRAECGTDLRYVSFWTLFPESDPEHGRCCRCDPRQGW